MNYYISDLHLFHKNVMNEGWEVLGTHLLFCKI